MITGGLAVSIMLALVQTTRAHGADQSIDAKLILTQTQKTETLVFLSRDADALFPAVGSADDPTAVGMTIELFTDQGRQHVSFAVPAAGWTASSGPVPRYRFRNRAAPEGPSRMRLVLQKQGRVLEVTGKAVGLLLLVDLRGPAAIRLTSGTLRNCARFEGRAIRKNAPGKFIGKTTPASSVVDCSDASLSPVKDVAASTPPRPTGRRAWF
jgi:hypothetical protein